MLAVKTSIFNDYKQVLKYLLIINIFHVLVILGGNFTLKFYFNLIEKLLMYLPLKIIDSFILLTTGGDRDLPEQYVVKYVL